MYAHLPLLHGPDGKKLSKRHGAASVQELRERGYLPAAVRNYLALLGWGDVDDQTILSTSELIERFDITRVSRNPARFDEQKLRWLNGRYMRALSLDELTEALERRTGRTGLRDAVAISAEKMQTLEDFWPLSGFIFDGPADDSVARAKWLDGDGQGALTDARAALAALSDPVSAEDVEAALRGVVEARHAKPMDVFQPVRVALAGTTVSPGIFETIAVLGRDEALRRIDAALAGAAA
jgi:glutamyl-tRNA synthetase